MKETNLKWIDFEGNKPSNTNIWDALWLRNNVTAIKNDIEINEKDITFNDNSGTAKLSTKGSNLETKTLELKFIKDTRTKIEDIIKQKNLGEITGKNDKVTKDDIWSAISKQVTNSNLKKEDIYIMIISDSSAKIITSSIDNENFRGGVSVTFTYKKLI
ncbi:hypothetical protein SGLAD_v1c08610 [Spiroplasma gladiatoris]|uniref:Uncharacterized protein n=1 Tax=Spiroplasma gladiatoris TaxID=2143 RepID=A0A4P7AKH4_9MOLU|nr:hypothetical protein [Spiroplasma gladiatoris]QBQ08060.1 hypothetical protein SGLAD_v1c08610 [Spiroplasma gladiatoris]